MMRTAYEWIIVPPADIVAALFVAVLGCMPVAMGAGAGWLSYIFVGPHGAAGSARRYAAIAVAAALGCYVTFVTFVALARMPAAISEWLRQ